MKKGFKYFPLLCGLVFVSLSSCSDENNTGSKQNQLELSEFEAVCIKDDLKKQLTEDEVLDLVKQMGIQTKGSSDTKISILNKKYKTILLNEDGLLKSNSISTDSIEYYELEIIENGKKGFSKVSSDSRVPCILYYIPKGNIADTSYIKGAALMMRGAEDIHVQSVINYNKLVDSLKDETITKICQFENIGKEVYKFGNYAKKYIDNYQQRNTELKQIIANYHIQTSWGQDAPYNGECPDYGCVETDNGRALAGCVAIATGQLLAHWRVQSGFEPTWNYQIFTQYLRVPTSDIAASAEVARFIHHIGESINMSYGCSGSGAVHTNALNYMRDNYDVQYERESSFATSKIGKYLYFVDGPVIYTPDWVQVGRHTWLVDGVMESMLTPGYYQIHCNLGYDGELNGWYGIDNYVLDGNNMIVYDATDIYYVHRDYID